MLEKTGPGIASPAIAALASDNVVLAPGNK